MAFKCAKNKKDLGPQGSHSPAVRHVTAHGNPTNRMLKNLGSDSILQVEPFLAQEATGGEKGLALVANKAPKA